MLREVLILRLGGELARVGLRAGAGMLLLPVVIHFQEPTGKEIGGETLGNQTFSRPFLGFGVGEPYQQGGDLGFGDVAIRQIPRNCGEARSFPRNRYGNLVQIRQATIDFV